MNYEKNVCIIRDYFRNYVKENNIKSVVLGISGGVDSALVAALVSPVCNELCIKLIGRSIPIGTNTQDEIERAREFGELFCNDFEEVDQNISLNVLNAFNEYLKPDTSIFKDKIRNGNTKARIRMIILYDTAKKNNGLVLSSDNWTEFCLSFWSQHGDVGDLGLIQNICKTDVYGMARYLRDRLTDERFKKAFDRIINSVPTDGLGITSSDLEQIGAESYEEVDKILKTWLVTDIDSFVWDDHLKYDGRIEDYDEFVKYKETLKDHPVVQRHINSEFKRNIPINIPIIDLDYKDH